jgi:hypothetical protein
MRKPLLAFLLLFFLLNESWGAFQIDTSTDTISLADNAVLTFPDADWTFVCRVKQTGFTFTTSPRVVSWNDGGSPNGFLLVPYNDGSVGFYAGDADTGTISLETAGGVYPADSAWHTFIITRATNTITVYLDNSSILNATDAAFDAIDFAGSFYFGNRAAASRALEGSIADCAKWDRALNASERAAYNAGFSAKCFPGWTWFTPMVRNFVELVKGIAMTNSGAVESAHPRLYDCS